MRQIRCGVFETNSSSTHSITICTEEDYEKFVHGELVYDNWNEELMSRSKAEQDGDGAADGRYSDYGSFMSGNTGWSCLDTYTEHFTTPSGDKMVAFGTYGYDG